MVTQQGLSSEERHAEHVRRLHQQLVLGLLQVLCPQSTVLLNRRQCVCLYVRLSHDSNNVNKNNDNYFNVLQVLDLQSAVPFNRWQCVCLHIHLSHDINNVNNNNDNYQCSTGPGPAVHSTPQLAAVCLSPCPSDT